ncbi:Lrp/AsnC ligand binding domain-containing protein [Caulobacter sp.]|uniref:Lrp/AsnC ligand binding domain-containing protein n=1 Tax=Caulobacter sp. TaxID=78 RepID=UPI002B461E77|nr:Lrp/AsnC ligand binding domain-containing protein [Caulobacter sp.]HJV40254.1 Lrp/AsnC ligand binding domain-containing protein [Caulobacter sp.]
MSLEQIHTGPGFLGLAADAGRSDLHRAHVMLRLALRDAADVEDALAGIAELTALHRITGDYDLVAIVEAPQADRLDALIARITTLRGVRAASASRLLPDRQRPSARAFAAE